MGGASADADHREERPGPVAIIIALLIALLGYLQSDPGQSCQTVRTGAVCPADVPPDITTGGPVDHK